MTVRAPDVSRLFVLCLTAAGLAAVAAGCRGSDSSTNVEDVAFASRNQQVEDFASRSRRFEDCCHHQVPPGRHRDECIEEARHGRCRLDCRPPQHEHDAGAPDAVAPTCPTLTPITTTPPDAGVIPFGGTIELSVSALDPSGGLAGLSFAWGSSSGGLLSGLTGSADPVEVDGSAVFRCTAGGITEVAATIPNSSCPMLLEDLIDLTCSFCGDGIVESGEQCDPPTPGVCGSDCQIATVCGDGILGPGEQCDPPHQGPDGLQCGANCRFLTCGNGVIDPGEQCDPPKSSGTAPLCSQTCQIPTCGNGVIDPGEQCDPPKSSGTAPLCSQTCQIPTCGNGVVDPGETCDPPTSGVCDSNCQSIPVVCGDGIVEPGETCDFFPVSNMYCENCQVTACGSCAFAHCNIGSACNTLTGADRTNCIALEGCLVPRTSSQLNCIAGGPSLVPCFCGVAPNVCSPTFTGQCVTQLEALAHTTDPATLMQLLSAPNTIYTAIGTELGCPAGSGCGRSCP
jgi:hypothetical protein